MQFLPSCIHLWCSCCMLMTVTVQKNYEFLHGVQKILLRSTVIVMNFSSNCALPGGVTLSWSQEDFRIFVVFACGYGFICFGQSRWTNLVHDVGWQQHDGTWFSHGEGNFGAEGCHCFEFRVKKTLCVLEGGSNCLYLSCALGSVCVCVCVCVCVFLFCCRFCWRSFSYELHADSREQIKAKSSSKSLMLALFLCFLYCFVFFLICFVFHPPLFQVQLFLKNISERKTVWMLGVHMYYKANHTFIGVLRGDYISDLLFEKCQ